MEHIVGEFLCTARRVSGEVITTDSILNKEKAVEAFRDILDRALSKKCRSIDVRFTADASSAPLFDYRYEEYVL